MKKLNLILSMATLFSLVGCRGETTKSTSSVSNSINSSNVNSTSNISNMTSSTSTNTTSSSTGSTGVVSSSITSSSVIENLVTFNIAVKTISGRRLNNVTVKIYKDSEFVKSVKTNYIGNASVEVPEGKYTATIEDLPKGIVANDNYVLEGKGGKVEFICVSSVIDEEIPEDLIYDEQELMYNFSYTDTNDNTSNLKAIFEEEKKDLVILTFWATWCGYCLNEFPYFNVADAAYGDRVSILGLNVDARDTADVIKTYQEEYEITWDMAVGDFYELYLRFGIVQPGYVSIPATVFINKYGAIESIHSGAFATEDDLLDLIDEFLSDIE